MSRAIPLALLLGAAIVGCGKKGGDAPQPGTGDPQSSGGVTPAGTPPTPTLQQRNELIRTVLGQKAVGGADAGDPANGVNGPIYELSQNVTDADIQAIRDPGFAFGLKLTSPKLTDAALVACGKLPSLMYLSVGKAKAYTAAGVAELAKLKHLRVLELTDLGADDSWLAALKPLTELRKLNLDGCYRVTDAGLAHLSGMTHLRELLLHGTNVTGSGLGALANAKGLARVVLPEQTDGALKALAKIGKLHALEEALTAAEERPATAADVTRFMIRGPVTDAGLKEVSAFPNLTHLHIQSDQVTAASLPFLKSLKKLKRLEVGFPITDEQREELTKALPGCELR
jgi:hypothetical protein